MPNSNQEKLREYKREYARRRYAEDPVFRERNKAHSLDGFRRRYAEDPAFRERERDRQFQRRYGITLVEYDTMLEAQGHKCAICGKGPGRKRLAVDHCHVSGTVRGLLCTDCNVAIALLGEDPATLTRAAEYLRKVA